MDRTEQTPKAFLTEDERQAALDKAVDILQAALTLKNWPAKPDNAEFTIATFNVLIDGAVTEMKLRFCLEFDENSWTSYLFRVDSDPFYSRDLHVSACDLVSLWEKLKDNATPI